MSKELKHLLLATTEDPFDPKSWSGIPYSLRTAMERQVEEVSVFRPPPPKRALLDVLKRILFGAGKFPLWITKATLKQNAWLLQREIARLQPDAVLSISSQCVVYLENPGRPTFLFSDAPYLAFTQAYARWETPPLRIAGFAEEEARAAQRLDGLCFGSSWACAEARRLFALSSDQTLHVTPLGANWFPQATRDQIFARIEERIARLAGKGLELLFIGRDWERKGGPLAVETAQLLRDAGHRVRLHVVGCRPELGDAAAPAGFVTVYGLLSHSDPVQVAQLAELFLRSHFLLVPTLAECFGIVFAEAQAFGLPPVARAVHALPSIVLDGETGLLLDPDAPASAYAERILACIEPARYRALAQRSREWFEQTLTWDRTAAAIVTVIQHTPTFPGR